MSEDSNYDRRCFLGAAAMTIAATTLVMSDAAHAQSSTTTAADATTMGPGTHTSFGPLKQIDAGLLHVGYAEAGPPDRPPVILLHGWPYDIHSYVEVAPVLAAAGYRVVVPYLRGYGTTRFLSSDTFRNGQPSALAVDIIALMDALNIEKATLAGFDWGARTVNIIAALWPERCKAIVSVSGYLIGSQASGQMPLPPKNELEWWYQYYFATERGRAGYDQYRHDFAKLIWQLASPQWHFDAATFDRSASSFDNPDHVAIVIHNYRWRLALAEGEPHYDDLEKRLAAGPVITVPTMTLEGDANGAPHPDASAYAKKFSGTYAHRIITGGVGHNLPQEAPQAFAEAVVAVADHGFRQRCVDWLRCHWRPIASEVHEKSATLSPPGWQGWPLSGRDERESDVALRCRTHGNTPSHASSEVCAMRQPPTRKYPAACKERAVTLVVESDQAIAQTARDLGVHEHTLHTWIGT